MVRSLSVLEELQAEEEEEEEKFCDTVSEADSALQAFSEVSMSLPNFVKKADMVELKAYNSPPVMVLIVMRGMAVVVTGKSNASWATCLKMLADPVGLVNRLVKFDLESATPKVFRMIHKATNGFAFTLPQLSSISKALYGMGSWLLAVRDYGVEKGILEREEPK